MKKGLDSIIQGLKEAIEYEKGDRKLKTSEVIIPDLPDYTSSQIKKIRKQKRITQKTFAMLLGVSEKTVEAWESGVNQPSGPAARIISLYELGLIDKLIKIRPNK